MNRVLHYEEGVDLTWLGTGICLLEDAQLMLRGKLPEYSPLGNLLVGDSFDHRLLNGCGTANDH